MLGRCPLCNGEGGRCVRRLGMESRSVHVGKFGVSGEPALLSRLPLSLLGHSVLDSRTDQLPAVPESRRRNTSPARQRKSNG